jgi:hypothetical protein
MNKTFLKVSTLLLMVTACVIVMVYGSPTKQFVSASDAMESSAPDSKVLPTGAKSKIILGKDSTTEYGEVEFDHDTHSFNKYSPDGTKDIGCAECHHTDQPKSALTGVLVTSERDEILTKDNLTKAGAPDVKNCRTCHFQEGNEPEGKEQPKATYKDDKGKSEVKILNSELAYHLNCNTCHDAAAKLRPELIKKKGFATSKDCLKCHKPN